MAHRLHNEEQPRLIALRLYPREVNALVDLLSSDLRPGSKKAGGVSPCTSAIVKILTAFVAPPGKCMVCGCTNDQPGKHGCKWVTPEHTLCLNCAGSG